MDEKLKKALVLYTKRLVEYRGLEYLLTFKSYNAGCGCLGPQGDEPLCPCAMGSALQKHLVEIINEIDPAAALAVLRSKIIQALR